MTDQNKNNKKQDYKTKSIKKQFKVKTTSEISLTNILCLCGMTLEEYKEGAAIHSKCFDQIRMLKTMSHN